MDLTYEAVLSTAPVDTLGKPAIWCLRGVGGGKALYKGEKGKFVYIENSGKTFGLPGSMHKTCDNALVVIKKFKIDESMGAISFRLYVDFIEYI